MREAVSGPQAVRFEAEKREALGSIAQAEKTGAKLDYILSHFAESKEVVAALGITPSSTASDQGYYLVQYKPVYGLKYIQELIQKRAEGVRLVIFADNANLSQIRSQFAAQLGDSFQVLPNEKINETVAESVAKLKSVAAQTGMIQLRTNVKADELKPELMRAALLGAVGLAQGRVVIASDSPIAGARQLTFFEIITATYQAAKAAAAAA